MDPQASLFKHVTPFESIPIEKVSALRALNPTYPVRPPMFITTIRERLTCDPVTKPVRKMIFFGMRSLREVYRLQRLQHRRGYQ